jgi:hypothetical protein
MEVSFDGKHTTFAIWNWADDFAEYKLNADELQKLREFIRDIIG